jgi:DNA polymerase (family 10)
VDAELDDLWLLCGVEVDIRKGGELDLAASCLSELDWVIASVHYQRELSEKDMTTRLLTAVESGLVHCIGHPLGRLIGRRDPLAFDVDRVLEACAEQGVRLEIDAQPDRLDLPDHICKRARDLGVGFAIDSDAHKPDDLDLIELGVAVGRRGWLGRADVLNTRSAAQLREELGR